MTANKEKRLVHPQRSAAMREDDHQVGIVNAHIIAKHRLRVQISRAWEDGSPGVNHDRQVVCLGPLVDRCQATVAVHVIVGRKHLMRGMHFDGANPEL